MDTGLFEFVCSFVSFVLKLSSLDTEGLQRFIKIVVIFYFPRQTATEMRSDLVFSPIRRLLVNRSWIWKISPLL